MFSDLDVGHIFTGRHDYSEHVNFGEETIMKMNTKYIVLAGLLSILAPGNAAIAADQQQTQNQTQNQVYGWELMSKQERSEYHTKMQNMKTAQEREQYRMEHHKMMQERAKAQGKTLPDMPHSGQGMGGGGMHQGMGQGSGGGKGK